MRCCCRRSERREFTPVVVFKLLGDPVQKKAVLAAIGPAVRAANEATFLSLKPAITPGGKVLDRTDAWHCMADDVPLARLRRHAEREEVAFVGLCVLTNDFQAGPVAWCGTVLVPSTLL